MAAVDETRPPAIPVTTVVNPIRRRPKSWLAVAVLLAAPALLLSPCLFGDRSYVPFDLAAFPPAVLLEIRGNQRRELAAGQLSQPGGVTAALGIIHVTDGTFTGGRLLRVRR